MEIDKEVWGSFFVGKNSMYFGKATKLEKFHGENS